MTRRMASDQEPSTGFRGLAAVTEASDALILGIERSFGPRLALTPIMLNVRLKRRGIFGVRRSGRLESRSELEVGTCETSLHRGRSSAKLRCFF